MSACSLECPHCGKEIALQVEASSIEPPPKATTRKLLSLPVEALNLSVGTYNALKNAKINTLAELTRYRAEDLRRIRLLRKSINEIQQLLENAGLSLATPPSIDESQEAK